MTSKEEKEAIKQQRIMRYFVEATMEIIRTEGIKSVSIRKVANLAGYTSATLYNYFDNLTHLIFLANMCHLEEYDEKLPACVEGCENSLEVYMSICKCYTLHAYDKPEIFESLFFSQKGDRYEKYTNQYYELYPERNKKDRAEFLNELSHLNNLHSRRLHLLNQCVEDGFIKEDDAQDFTDICLRFYKTILQDVKDRTLKKNEAVSLTLKYDYKLISLFIKPEYKRLVEDYAKELIETI